MKSKFGKKRKHVLPDGDINITSLMDILTTLLFFIMMVMSLQKFSVIDSTSLTATEPSKDPKPTFALQLTILSPEELSLWIGPIKGLEGSMVNTHYVKKLISSRFKGNEESGYSLSVKADDLPSLLDKIQDTLVEVKIGFPEEMRAVISFTDVIKYQEMIDAIAAVRELGPEKEGFVYQRLNSEKEKTKVLFPQVIIAEESQG
jgi:biopolymer transport protein ExbD